MKLYLLCDILLERRTSGLFTHNYGRRGDCSVGQHILGLSLSPVLGTSTILFKIK